jgi:hypothetical protein
MDLLRIITIVEVVAFAGVLCACSTLNDKLATTSTTPVCSALIGPIKYNSQKPNSKRFAGPALAPDLKQRNQVGEKLHCPQYR